jgi:hypothetical protein
LDPVIHVLAVDGTPVNANMTLEELGVTELTLVLHIPGIISAFPLDTPLSLSFSLSLSLIFLDGG